MKSAIPKRSSEEIPQSSMADVAFLLLIFFIVTTIFNTEKGIPLALPGKSSVTAPVNPKNILKITSDSDGSVYINEESFPIRALESEIRSRLAENPDKLVISIQSHPESNYQTMMAILDEVKKAEAPRVSLKLRRL